MARFIPTNYNAKFRMFKGHEIFERELMRHGGEYGEVLLRQLFTEIKAKIPDVIDANRKTERGVNSPVGYTQGKLGKSVRFRVRKWNTTNGTKVRGYLYVGEGLSYARIHDFDGVKKIRAKTPRGLVFYDHIRKRWIGFGPTKKKTVNRPGSPYFDEAVNYSMRKLGI